MAQKRDMFDDIIDITKGLSGITEPFSDLTNAFLGNPEPEEREWNPADYKEKPRANALSCLACRSTKSSCRACVKICPVNAIEIEDGGIDVLDSCRKCGLCAPVCPTESTHGMKHRPKKFYDSVAAAAAAYETAYVTCTRALKRIPRENEVVLGCVGEVTAETWFSILMDFPNVSVYLPLDICENCRNAQGEELLGDAIATAEEWSGRPMGLEVDAKELSCTKRREFERKEYMDKIMKTTGLAVSKLNPATAAVTTVSQRIKDHTKKLSALERTLATATGTTSQRRRRVLTQGRQLLLSTLQAHPELAPNVQVSTPVCDFEKCTLCGDCIEACPLHACDITDSGRFAVESTYCVGCGLCAEVCETHALTMVEHDAAELVLPDPEAEKKAAEAAKAHEEAEKMKAEAKKKLSAALDRVEKLAD